MDENGQVEGRNAVSELLDSDKDINKIFVQAGEKHGKIVEVIAKAKKTGVVVVETSKKKLDEMSETKNHQGIIAVVPPYEYVEVRRYIRFCKRAKRRSIYINIRWNRRCA